MIVAHRDAITAQIAAALEPSILAAEVKRQRERPFHELDAAGCVSMALSITKTRTQQSYATAERLLKSAIELDPACTRAHAIAAWVCGDPRHLWVESAGTLPLALEAAHKAIHLDDHDPWSHFASGWTLLQSRSPEEAIEEFQIALAHNPYFTHVRYCLGQALAYIGETERALTELEIGERLNASEIFVGHRNSAAPPLIFARRDRGKRS
jgi:adenylate cyclase